MKTTLRFILLFLVSIGFATAAFAGATGIAISPASASSVVFILIYTMVGSMLVVLADYKRRRPIQLPAKLRARPVAPFVTRYDVRDDNRKAA